VGVAKSMMVELTDETNQAQCECPQCSFLCDLTRHSRLCVSPHHLVYRIHIRPVPRRNAQPSGNSPSERVRYRVLERIPLLFAVSRHVDFHVLCFYHVRILSQGGEHYPLELAVVD
jgi:hypothetical protein